MAADVRRLSLSTWRRRHRLAAPPESERERGGTETNGPSLMLRIPTLLSLFPTTSPALPLAVLNVPPVMFMVPLPFAPLPTTRPRTPTVPGGLENALAVNLRDVERELGRGRR